eukprot:m.160239 g.160239  ORF g.160239 m.160239 type:complete len:135 (-) comp31177_c0_seq1:20-424(-)
MITQQSAVELCLATSSSVKIGKEPADWVSATVWRPLSRSIAASVAANNGSRSASLALRETLFELCISRSTIDFDISKNGWAHNQFSISTQCETKKGNIKLLNNPSRETASFQVGKHTHSGCGRVLDMCTRDVLD